MAVEIPGFSFTREAAADLRTKQFYFMIASGGRAGLPGADGLMCIGVIQNDPNIYEEATIVGDGISKVVSDGSIEVDKPIACANGGRAKEAASGEHVQGIALEGDGGVAGTVISVLLRPQGRLA
jgi:hypothetical protein